MVKALLNPKQSNLLLPGRKGVLEVLRHRPTQLRCVYLREGISLDPEFTELLALRQREHNLLVETVNRQEFEHYELSGMTQGVAALVRGAEVEEEWLFDAVVEQQGILLVCDQIADPQNLGALIRVAEAAGAVGVLITKDRSADVTPSVRKASAGATELIPIAKSKNLQRSIERLKKRGVWIVGTALDATSQPLYQAPRLKPAAIILGSEGEGMRRLSKSLCDVLIEIPMRGAIQSLNVSQAASVLLYEMTSPQRVTRTEGGEE